MAEMVAHQRAGLLVAAGDVEQRDGGAEAAGEPTADAHVVLAGLAGAGADENALEGGRVGGGAANDQHRGEWTLEQAHDEAVDAVRLVGAGPGSGGAGGTDDEQLVEGLLLLDGDLAEGVAGADLDFGTLEAELGALLVERGAERVGLVGL